jgi:hypothetical protein
MPAARKRPCSICRRWFRPDPRVGLRQHTCGKPDCQAARRRKTQARWRTKNPDTQTPLFKIRSRWKWLRLMTFRERFAARKALDRGIRMTDAERLLTFREWFEL